MDDALRAQIILAAANAAGPVGDDEAAWTERVNEYAAKMVVLMGPHSPVSKTIAAMEASAVFTGVIKGIVKEKSSQRALITIYTRPSENYPDGMESIRTERLDNPSAGGRALARRVHSLVGHRVLVWVEKETIRGGTKKVRVLRHIEDLGEPREMPDADAA